MAALIQTRLLMVVAVAVALRLLAQMEQLVHQEMVAQEPHHLFLVAALLTLVVAAVELLCLAQLLEQVVLAVAALVEHLKQMEHLAQQILAAALGAVDKAHLLLVTVEPAALAL